MLSSQAKPRVLAKMDLEVEGQIPQTRLSILSPHSHSVLTDYDRKGNYESQTYSWPDIWDSNWLDLFASESFQVLFTPLIGNRVLFDFFEFICVGTWLWA